MFLHLLLSDLVCRVVRTGQSFLPVQQRHLELVVFCWNLVDFDLCFQLSTLRRLDWWTNVAEKMADCSVCAGNFSERCTDTAGLAHMLWWWWVIRLQRSRYILMKVVVIYLESLTLDLWEEVSLSLVQNGTKQSLYVIMMTDETSIVGKSTICPDLDRHKIQH